MKKTKLLLIGFLSMVLFASAQTSESKIALGLNYVKNEYYGDYGNGIWKFGNYDWRSAGGISLAAFLNHSFDLGLQGSYGIYGYRETNAHYFTGLKLDASLFVNYKFDNGYILDVNSRLSPFISLGAGVATYSINSAVDKSGTNKAIFPTIITDGTDFVIPLGAGVTYHLSNFFSIQYQYLYNITNSDIHDQNISGGLNNRFFGTPAHPFSKPGNDAYGQHIVSLIYVITESATRNKCKCNYR